MRDTARIWNGLETPLLDFQTVNGGIGRMGQLPLIGSSSSGVKKPSKMWTTCLVQGSAKAVDLPAASRENRSQASADEGEAC
jgi:hypothetical protein